MKRILKLLIIGVMVLFPNMVHAETLDVNSEEVNTLMNKISIEKNRFGDWFGYYYKKDKVTINDFSNQMKLYFAARTFNKDESDEGSNGLDVIVSKEQMSTAMKNIFGPDVKYNDETIKVDPTLLAKGTYDNTKQEYTLSFDHVWGDEFFDGYPYYFSERINANKDNQKIEVNEKAMYYEMFNKNDKFCIKMYRISPKTFITESNVGDERAYLRLFGEYMDTYKYTFKKGSDGEYYFYSVENLKDAKIYQQSNAKGNITVSNPKTADNNLLLLLGVGIAMVFIIIFSSKKILKK